MILKLHICNQLHSLAFCDNEMRMNVLHVIGDLFYIFPTFLLYFSFLLSLCSFATLISSFELKVWFTRKSKLNLLLIKMYHAYAHMLHSLSMNYIPSNYALQPWIQNFLKLSKSLKEESSGNFSKTKKKYKFSFNHKYISQK